MSTIYLIAMLCQVHASDSANHTDYIQSQCQAKLARCVNTSPRKSLEGCVMERGR